MKRDNLVKVSIKNDKTDEVIAELSVKEGLVEVDYGDGNKPLHICRAALLTDCIGKMYNAIQDDNDKELKENANDFLLALLLNENGEMPDIYMSCESHDGCDNDKNCAKA